MSGREKALTKYTRIDKGIRFYVVTIAKNNEWLNLNSAAASALNSKTLENFKGKGWNHRVVEIASHESVGVIHL